MGQRYFARVASPATYFGVSNLTAARVQIVDNAVELVRREAGELGVIGDPAARFFLVDSCRAEFRF